MFGTLRRFTRLFYRSGSCFHSFFCQIIKEPFLQHGLECFFRSVTISSVFPLTLSSSCSPGGPIRCTFIPRISPLICLSFFSPSSFLSELYTFRYVLRSTDSILGNFQSLLTATRYGRFNFSRYIFHLPDSFTSRGYILTKNYSRDEVASSCRGCQSANPLPSTLPSGPSV